MKTIPSLIILFSVLLTACGSSSTPGPTPTPEESAWMACTLFVKQQVGLSDLDAQEYNLSGVTKLADDRFQVEVFYADQGQTYMCELIRPSEESWQLESLEVR